LNSPPVRSLTSTPVKELVFPVLLRMEYQYYRRWYVVFKDLPSNVEKLRVKQCSIEQISHEVFGIVWVSDGAFVLRRKSAG
jgi:hypothetical protein